MMMSSVSNHFPKIWCISHSCHTDRFHLLISLLLLYGISDKLYRRLQVVQNAAARLITNTRRCEHITPILQLLQWLPIHQRVQFKIAMLVYKALHVLPVYLMEDCQLVSVVGH